MGLQQEGEFGLRRRLRMALESDGDYSRVAGTLQIDEGDLEEYLTDPNFYWDTDSYELILSNLSLLPLYEHVRDTGDHWQVIFTEKARWTASDLITIEKPDGATEVAVFIEAEGYAEDIATQGPVDSDLYSALQVANAATGGDYDRLFTVVWYIPIYLYPH